MTAQETSLVVGALVGLMGAIQLWLIGRSVKHDNRINGLMANRITTGAEKVVADYHATVHEVAPASEPAQPRRFTPGVR